MFTQILKILKIYSDDPEKVGEYPIRVIVYLYSEYVTYANSVNLDFVVKVHGAGQFVRAPLLITSSSINEQGLFTLTFN